MKYFILIFLCFGVGVTQGVSGSISGKQPKAENMMASAIASIFGMYAVTHDGALPTTWESLQETSGTSFWHNKELEFREFGANKGFANSIFEKYVFVTPPVRLASYKELTGYEGPVSPSEPAEILFMSAMPFQEGDEMVRKMIFIRGTNIFGSGVLETRVQKSFELAGRTIPIAAPAASAIDPAKVAAEAEFFRSSKESFEQFRKERPELFEGEVELPRESPPRRSQFRPPDKMNVTNEDQTIAAAEPAKNTWWLISFVLAGTAALGIYFWRRGRSGQRK